MDVLTPEQRHINMSRIRSKNTKPEKSLMKELRNKGIWFTSHRKDVFGKPDIVFKRKKIAVFVDSEFWHGRKHLPKTNQEFWIKKLERNRQRDEEVNVFLLNQNWSVIRFSDTVVKKHSDICADLVITFLANSGLERTSSFNGLLIDNRNSNKLIHINLAEDER